MKAYKAVVRDKRTKGFAIIEGNSISKASFIKELRANGYAVNPLKVKGVNKFDHIMNTTNCEVWDWLEITEQAYINRVAGKK